MLYGFNPLVIIMLLKKVILRLFAAKGVSAMELLESNARAFDQITANFSSMKVIVLEHINSKSTSF